MKIQKVIHAEDGMILTNGEVYGKIVFLADGSDENSFHEITDAEYEEIRKREEARAEETI